MYDAENVRSLCDKNNGKVLNLRNSTFRILKVYIVKLVGKSKFLKLEKGSNVFEIVYEMQVVLHDGTSGTRVSLALDRFFSFCVRVDF